MNRKFLFLLLVIAAALFYLYRHPALQQQLLGQARQIAPQLGTTTLYKWQNSNGVWQYTDQPPAKGIPYTTVDADSRVNVLPVAPTKKPH